MIAVSIVILVVLAAIGWFQLRDRIADQGVQAAETCVEGTVVVPVTVDPDISDQVTDLAGRYSDTGPVVRDHCVSLEVRTQNSGEVNSALKSVDAGWDSAALGPLPALWIPRSSDAISDLPPGSVDGTPRSVASTPVVLAGPKELTRALSDSGIGWADLPRLQSTPESLDSLGLSGWGALRLLLPVGEESDSTSAALAAISVDVSGPVDGPLTAEVARGGPSATALSSLSNTDRAAAAAVPDSTAAALAQLGSDLTATSDVHAVPATEQELTASKQSDLTSYSPTGSTPVADHPAVILAGAWMDETLSRAAAQFVEFARQPENAQLFVDAGFDAGTMTPSAIPTTSADVEQGLIDAVQNPATPRRTTTLLDISGSMDVDEGGRSRLQNTVDALNLQFESAIDTTELGLWVYSKNLDGTRAFRIEVPTGPIDEQLSSGTRREELIAAGTALQPETATSTYESVMAAYVDAQTHYVAGRPNTVVLVTDGPNDDTSISASRFVSMLSDIEDPSRPVSIDVVSIGTNSDTPTLQSISDITGGTLTTVGSSDSPELPDLLRKLLY